MSVEHARQHNMRDDTITDLKITVAICAYNEEKIIEKCIRSIYTQNCPGIVIDEVIVVSSNSTDNTDKIVEKLINEFPNLHLIRQERREGKNSAINCYLDAKNNDIVAMLNADNVLLTDSSLYALISPFFDEKTGMVGGHPIPTNDPKNDIGFAVQLLWTFHHHIALIYPKIGELVAFRDIGTRLPTDQQSDEDLIRKNLEDNGYKCLYAPDALVQNRGPETYEDFMKQRTRVNVGECMMKKKLNYDIPSWNKKILIRAMFGTIKDLGFHPIKMLKAVMMELKARKFAKKYIADGNEDMSVWDPVATTKKL